MSVTYPDLTRTGFPNQLDQKQNWRDPSASEFPLINQYRSLILAGQKVAAMEFLQNNPSLEESLLNADKMLQVHDAIIALQRYFFNNIQEHIAKIGNNKGQWNEYMSSTASGENRLDKFDTVLYPVDGVQQIFLVYGDNIVAGEVPTEHRDKFLQLSIKGDRGDDGYTPVKGVDYFDGASGLGLSPRGEWLRNKEYYQYDLVSYQQFLWYCTEDNLAQEPSNESTIWHKMDIVQQVYVGTSIPRTLEEGGLWLHVQDDGHVIMKRHKADDTFVPIYPEMDAQYVKDSTGASLQKKIYQHYFERDDIKTTLVQNDNVYTSTATLLSNPSITVAKCVTTSNLDIDGTCVEELTCYDETGILIMYKCKTTLTVHEDGSYTSVPEVII